MYDCSTRSCIFMRHTKQGGYMNENTSSQSSKSVYYNAMSQLQYRYVAVALLGAEPGGPGLSSAHTCVHSGTIQLNDSSFGDSLDMYTLCLTVRPVSGPHVDSVCPHQDGLFVIL